MIPGVLSSTAVRDRVSGLRFFEILARFDIVGQRAEYACARGSHDHQEDSRVE